MSKDKEDLQSSFSDAVFIIESSCILFSNKDLSILYSYYKQATIGDCKTEAPSFWNFKGKTRFKAWNKLKGMSKERAMKNFIIKVEELTYE